MEKKPFAVGMRIEHPAELISRSQYGESYRKLPNADYKLAVHLPNGRGFTRSVCAPAEPLSVQLRLKSMSSRTA